MMVIALFDTRRKETRLDGRAELGHRSSSWVAQDKPRAANAAEKELVRMPHTQTARECYLGTTLESLQVTDTYAGLSRLMGYIPSTREATANRHRCKGSTISTGRAQTPWVARAKGLSGSFGQDIPVYLLIVCQQRGQLCLLDAAPRRRKVCLFD